LLIEAPTLTGVKSNSDPRSEKPASERLSCGAAKEAVFERIFSSQWAYVFSETLIS
jgi:hypothetical protein